MYVCMYVACLGRCVDTLTHRCTRLIDITPIYICAQASKDQFYAFAA